MNTNFGRILLGNLCGVVVSGFIVGTAVAGSAPDSTEPRTPLHGHTVGSALSSLSDNAITGRVKRKIKNEASLKNSNINVSTSDGVVMLYGSVNDDQAKSLAESIVNSIKGVKSIHNRLETSSGGATPRPAGP
ncbi:MAG: BON domain-containing protein [Gallionella sp.]|jgi:osmotically-inducible protein OsmY